MRPLKFVVVSHASSNLTELFCKEHEKTAASNCAKLDIFHINAIQKNLPTAAIHLLLQGNIIKLIKPKWHWIRSVF